jgi:hypothetical protein
MCANLFGGSKSPKVEKVAPAPQAVTGAETDAMSDRSAAEAERQRKKRGYAATRVADDRNVLTDTAQSGTRQTLG